MLPVKETYAEWKVDSFIIQTIILVTEVQCICPRVVYDQLYCKCLSFQLHRFGLVLGTSVQI